MEAKPGFPDFQTNTTKTHYPSIFGTSQKKRDIFAVGPGVPTASSGIQKHSSIAKRISYSNNKPPLQKTGFHIAGTHIINEGSHSTPNKVILMSRNVFAHQKDFSTTEGI